MKAESAKSSDQERKKEPSAAIARNHNWTNIHGQCERISSEDLYQQCTCAHMEQQAF